MARLPIDKDFLDDYSKLPKPVQNSVKTAIDKFAEHVHAGLHHVIIDEAQDLHPAQWRLPRTVVPAAPMTCSSPATPTSASTTTASRSRGSASTSGASQLPHHPRDFRPGRSRAW
jgi:hypothetical protein